MFTQFCVQYALIFFCLFMFCAFSFSAVKRLMKEAAELKDPTDHYHAQPLEVCLSMCLQALAMRQCGVYYMFSVCKCI